MLLAPDSPTSSSSRSRQGETSLNYALISICFALFAFSLMIGIGLATGRVPLERAFSMMSIGPFLLALWQFYGYVSNGGRRDIGLILGGIGWLQIGIALLVQQGFFNAAVLAGTSANQIGTSPLTRILVILGSLLVAVGAALSFSHWQNLNRNA